MYQVYIDGVSAYAPNDGLVLQSPKLDLELNKAGSFTFEIYPSHPQYGLIHKLSSVVTVYDESQLVFSGRVLNDDADFYNVKSIYCEGELSYLVDSVQRPYDYQGTLEGLFEQFVASHNTQVGESRRFAVGEVTVEDGNDYVHYSDTTYLTTLDSMVQKLVNTHGGYLSVRHEDGTTYLDYLSDFDILSGQAVEFGRNLLDLGKSSRGEDIKTAIVPLGKRDEETDRRLTIESVNDGVDFVYDADAVETYGYIFESVTWDDVTEASNLKTKGQAYLADRINSVNEITLSALDLSALDSSISSFHLGTYVRVNSGPHSLAQNFLVEKLSISLDSPESNKLTLGAVTRSFTESSRGQAVENRTNVEVLRETLNNRTARIESQVSSEITQTAENILQVVSEEYYLRDDADTLVSSINTRFEQTNEEFTFAFNQFTQDLNDVASDTDARFEDIRKYIRFVDGNIILGEDGNELILKIQNDRISFLQGNLEVAYFSNQKLYVKDGEYLNSLILGKFAFLPRQNGNLSFKKVVD